VYNLAIGIEPAGGGAFHSKLGELMASEQAEVETTQGDQKLVYHKPQLIIYGLMRDLTKTFPPQTSHNDNTTPYGHVGS
jgi:hypothetical protein